VGTVNMIKKLLVFIALFLAVVSASKAAKKYECCPPNAKEYCAPSGKKFVVFGCECRMNRADAEAACCAIGTRLAALHDGPDYCFLTEKVHEISWISTWNGSNFNAALAFFPGGAIGVPIGGSQSLQGAICEC
jgi:hypothetical protein